MSATTIAISLVGNDLTGGAFGSLLGNVNRVTGGLGIFGQALKSLSPQMQGLGATAIAAALAFEMFKAPVDYGIEAAGQLEYKLVSLQNALQADADTAPLLTAAINDMAIRTVFSSGEASDAFTQLVEMGFNAQDVLYGFGPATDALMDGSYHAKEALDGLGNQALDMAQAMRTDATQGAELLGAALNTFKNDGMSAKEAANLLTGAFLNGVPSAEALQQAIAMGGASASTAGVTMKEYLGIIDLLTRSGMSASSAGASLQYAIQSLTAPTDKQKQALKDLHLVTLGGADGMQILSSKMFDAQGNFIGLKAAIDLIDQAMIGKTAEQKMEAFADLFNVRSGRAAKVLSNISDFDAQYDEIMQRFAGTDVGAMADKQLHTLLGAWDAFKDSFTSMMAVIFLPVLPTITDFILKINDLFSAIMKLPEEARKNVAIFLILGMVFSGLLMVITGVIFIVGFLSALFAIMGPVLAGVAAAFGVIIGVILIAVGVFFAIKTAIESNKDLMNAWNAVIGFLGAMLGVLKDQGMQLLNSLHLLLPVWDVLKVVLMVIAGVIVGVLIVAVAIVIGVFIALAVVIRVIIQVLAVVGSAIGSFFSWLGTQLHGIPALWKATWDSVGLAIHNALMGIITGVGGFFSNLGSKVQAGMQAVKDIFNNAVQAVVGFFKWLYDHNYYFQDLVDFIRNSFNTARAFITAVWSAISSYLSGVWHTLVSIVTTVWSMITSHINSGSHQAQSTITSVWNAIRGFFSAIWNAIVAIASGAIHAFVGVISSGIGAASNAAHGIVNGIQNVINGLKSFMSSAGAAAMHMFADAMGRAAGAVIAKAQEIAGKIKSLLGFHSPPEEGPLSDSDEYMPNMMRMYARGMEDHLPLLGDSLDKVAGTFQTAFTTPRTQQAITTAQSAQGGTVVIPITMDGKQIAQYTLDLANRKLVQSGAARYAR